MFKYLISTYVLFIYLGYCFKETLLSLTSQGICTHYLLFTAHVALFTRGQHVDKFHSHQHIIRLVKVNI